MKTRKQEYIEWLSVEQLHLESVQWLSELDFAKDEQRFLNSLINDYTLDLIDKSVFKVSKNSVEDLSLSEKKLADIIKAVQLHENQLSIMADDVDQLKMENAYQQTHIDLKKKMETYFSAYRAIKETVFKLISDIMKKKKTEATVTLICSLLIYSFQST